MAERLRVQGQCKCGRKVNTFAKAGRATYVTACPRQDCDGKITCRRVPDTAAATPPVDEPQTEPATVEEPSSGRRTPRKVVKVNAYRRRTPDAPGRDPGVPGAGAEPTGSGSTQGPPGPDSEPGPGAGGEPPTVEPERQRPEPARRAAQPETGRRAHPYSHLGFNW